MPTFVPASRAISPHSDTSSNGSKGYGCRSALSAYVQLSDLEEELSEMKAARNRKKSEGIGFDLKTGVFLEDEDFCPGDEEYPAACQECPFPISPTHGLRENPGDWHVKYPWWYCGQNCGPQCCGALPDKYRRAAEASRRVGNPPLRMNNDGLTCKRLSNLVDI